MASSNITGGIITGDTIYAPVLSTPIMRATTLRASTKMSAASYNIRTAFVKNTDARASNAVAGLDVGDIILSQPGYVRFSSNVSRATSGIVATARVKSANVASITGIVSNSMIFIAWAKY